MKRFLASNIKSKPSKFGKYLPSFYNVPPMKLNTFSPWTFLEHLEKNLPLSELVVRFFYLPISPQFILTTYLSVRQRAVLSPLGTRIVQGIGRQKYIFRD